MQRKASNTRRADVKKFYRAPTLPDTAQIEQVFARLKERNLLSADFTASDLIGGRGIVEESERGC